MSLRTYFIAATADVLSASAAVAVIPVGAFDLSGLRLIAHRGDQPAPLTAQYVQPWEQRLLKVEADYRQASNLS